MTDQKTRFMTVFERELQTLRRTRSVWFLAGGFLALMLGIALVSGTSGYVPLSLTLLTPLELLIPVFAAAIGYRAILTDRTRGELAVLRTYPIISDTYAWAVYCGRLAGFLSIVVGSLLLVGILVPLISPSPAVLTRTSGLDSALYYARFIVLTAVFAAVMLAVIVLLSAIARTARRGLVGGVIVVTLAAVGLDLAIILGLAENLIPQGALPWFLALSPTSAYRGLVMVYVVAPVATTAVRPAAPLASILSLSVWLFLPLFAAGWLTWGPATYRQA